MFCSKCGKALAADSRFCAACGARIRRGSGVVENGEAKKMGAGRPPAAMKGEP